MKIEQRKRDIFTTFLAMLHSKKGLTQKKFRQLLRKTGWVTVDHMAHHLLQLNAIIVTKNGERQPVESIIKMVGGCSSYYRINLRLVGNGTWKQICIPPEVPTIIEIVQFAKRLKEEGRPVKLSRNQRRRIGNLKLEDGSMTVSELPQTLKST